MNKKMYVFLTAVFLLTLGTNLAARGNVDARGVDGETLQTQFELWLDRMEAGEMTGDEVMAQVREFQRSRNMVNEQELKEYQNCVDQLQEGDMTREQVRERIREMEQLQTEEKLQTRDGSGSGEPAGEGAGENPGNGQAGKK
ncbi:hypothetical protein [Spirochaeta isovalerica]|uniref:Uncharacterized protein n=1 Tax=Spirochaeta isovalerica TaxID=150 RepID=A0A841RCT1_9SPIO|nr:hypothetical protein [Spirochaeta isovalerica]MBB6480800.1 hypothetical protein [Spirochaeta isovalerica]